MYKGDADWVKDPNFAFSQFNNDYTQMYIPTRFQPQAAAIARQIYLTHKHNKDFTMSALKVLFEDKWEKECQVELDKCYQDFDEPWDYNK